MLTYFVLAVLVVLIVGALWIPAGYVLRARGGSGLFQGIDGRLVTLVQLPALVFFLGLATRVLVLPAVYGTRPGLGGDERSALLVAWADVANGCMLLGGGGAIVAWAALCWRFAAGDLDRGRGGERAPE